MRNHCDLLVVSYNTPIKNKNNQMKICLKYGLHCAFFHKRSKNNIQKINDINKNIFVPSSMGPSVSLPF